MSSIGLNLRSIVTIGIAGGNFFSSGFCCPVAGLIGWLEAWVFSFSLAAESAAAVGF
jgi:hypothetical protein